MEPPGLKSAAGLGQHQLDDFLSAAVLAGAKASVGCLLGHGTPSLALARQEVEHRVVKPERGPVLVALDKPARRLEGRGDPPFRLVALYPMVRDFPDSVGLAIVKNSCNPPVEDLSSRWRHGLDQGEVERSMPKEIMIPLCAQGSLSEERIKK